MHWQYAILYIMQYCVKIFSFLCSYDLINITRVKLRDYYTEDRKPLYGCFANFAEREISSESALFA